MIVYCIPNWLEHEVQSFKYWNYRHTKTETDIFPWLRGRNPSNVAVLRGKAREMTGPWGQSFMNEIRTF